jgi:hypothetical protein
LSIRRSVDARSWERGGWRWEVGAENGKWWLEVGVGVGVGTGLGVVAGSGEWGVGSGEWGVGSGIEEGERWDSHWEERAGGKWE